MAAKRSSRSSTRRSSKSAKKPPAKPRQRARGAGRKPKPSALHELHGTARANRTQPDQPAPDVGMPNAPDWLDDQTAQAWWDMAPELVGAQVLTKMDRPTYLLLVTAAVRYRRAWEDYREHGSTAWRENKYGKYLTRSPYAVELDAAAHRFQSLCSEYGLSPAARTRVAAIKPPEEGDPEAAKYAEYFGRAS